MIRFTRDFTFGDPLSELLTPSCITCGFGSILTNCILLHGIYEKYKDQGMIYLRMISPWFWVTICYANNFMGLQVLRSLLSHATSLVGRNLALIRKLVRLLACRVSDFWQGKCVPDTSSFFGVSVSSWCKFYWPTSYRRWFSDLKWTHYQMVNVHR